MTREEAIAVLNMVEAHGSLVVEAKDMAIKALEQMPSDDKVTITMKKGTLKCINQGYVIYNKDWFRKHFATEVMVMTGYDGYIEKAIPLDKVKQAREEMDKLASHKVRPISFDQAVAIDMCIGILDKLIESEG